MGRPGPLTTEQRHLRQVRLRPPGDDDSALLMAWRNDPATVGFSLSGCAVTAEEHERWFAKVRDDPAHHRLWIAEDDGQPVGQVRIDVTGDTGSVSIAVESGRRGRGLGTAMLRALLATIAAEGVLSRMTAVVRADNAASLRAFAAVGFRQTASEPVFLELEWP
jgi:UDP-2,4-diacetamido-2,4,6-trideoxy-beta-L-altropyranose hydrolase